MDIRQMLGSRIKDIRTKKGMSQEKLSEKMGINPKYLSSIERGKENPTLNTFIKLAQSLKVDIGEIFNFIQAEDSSKRKSLVKSLLKEADSEQLKLALKILSAIIR
ncbi:MAG: helix-turn-helix transcriptional regulator [Deltaproteobacteria bacterium]|nr:helix-turn-helix transcriptional regulator [Deltaproteobacteria bacterium]